MQGYGTVFEITPTGTLTTLHSFCSQSGCPDGLFTYGAGLGYQWRHLRNNRHGGTGANCLTPLRLWDDLQDYPERQANDALQLLLATRLRRRRRSQRTDPGRQWQSIRDNRESGGANRHGTIFKITPTGTLTTLYSFCAQSGLPRWTMPARSSAGHQWNLLWNNSTERGEPTTTEQSSPSPPAKPHSSKPAPPPAWSARQSRSSDTD